CCGRQSISCESGGEASNPKGRTQLGGLSGERFGRRMHGHASSWGQTALRPDPPDPVLFWKAQMTFRKREQFERADASPCVKLSVNPPHSFLHNHSSPSRTP